MESNLHLRASQIANVALTQPPDERDAYVKSACDGDQVLKTMIDGILSPDAYDETSGLETVAVSFPAAVTAHAGAAASPRRVLFSEDLSGSRVGLYQLIRRIGKGGMGAVYAARRVDQDYLKTVAVKLVKPGTETEEILLRFEQERQVLASLDHPNIARLLDGGTEGRIPYLVMEYVEGTPIDYYCRTQELGVTERLRLFCTVCSAVQFAHQNLVVHRDLKPANIMVSTEGVPKLLDFGIAKVLHPDLAETAAMTKASERPMTPDYASPEQVRGEPVTTASDVYALGVLLYELLTTQHPFRRMYEKVGFHRAVCEVDPTRPSVAASQLTNDPGTTIPDGTCEKLRSRLRGDLDSIVMMALRKEPSRRYASVQHLLDDIQRHLSGQPVRAHKDTLRYRTAKFVRRNTAGVIAAAGVAIALVTSSIVSWVFYGQANLERQRAEARFSDVRQLAKFVLFDFENVIAAGVTPARKALLEKATEYLDRLEKDRGGDSSLEQELIEGYLKVGDLQGNLLGPNLGNREAAQHNYERALRVLESSRKPNPVFVAQTRVRLADIQAQRGLVSKSIESYKQARDILARIASGSPQAKDAYAEVLRKLAMEQRQAGDYRGSLATYQVFQRTALELLRGAPKSNAYREMTALATLRTGDAQARMGDLERGLSEMKRALSAYQEIASENTHSALPYRRVAQTSALIGDILVLEKRYKDAADYFRKALQVSESLLEGDPRNEQCQRDVFTYAARLADAVAHTGDMAEARTLTRRALSTLRPLVEKPDASQQSLHQYAWILLTTPVPGMRDNLTAQRYAERLVEMTQGQDPYTLDVLAMACAGVGQVKRAIEIEKKALGLLPAGSASALRTALERNLAMFQSTPATLHKSQ